MPSLPLCFAVRPEESAEILRVFAEARLKEAIDLSCLTDDDIEHLTSSKDVQVFVQACGSGDWQGPLRKWILCMSVWRGSDLRAPPVALLHHPEEVNEPMRRSRDLPWQSRWVKWCNPMLRFLPRP